MCLCVMPYVCLRKTQWFILTVIWSTSCHSPAEFVYERDLFCLTGNISPPFFWFSQLLGLFDTLNLQHMHVDYCSEITAAEQVKWNLCNFWVRETKIIFKWDVILALGHSSPVLLVKWMLSYVFWAIIIFWAEAWCIVCKLLKFLFDAVSQMQIFMKWPNPVPLGTKFMFVLGVQVNIVSAVWS